MIRMQTELDEMRKRFDLWFGAGSCSVCGGTPLASGRPCVCGGKGTMQAEFEGLRLECLSLERQLSAGNCDHPEPAVNADIHNGDIGDHSVQWCQACGAYRFGYYDGGKTTVGEWHIPGESETIKQ